MAKMKLKVILHEEEGGFWAEVPALQGCYSQGRTRKEVKANLAEAIQGYLETMEEEIFAQRKGAHFEEVLV
jgi:predicted RNase H-like HicB family nuclease